MPHFFKGPNSVLKAIGRKLKAEPDGDFSAECSLAQSVKYRLQQLESPVNAVNRGSFDDTLRARIRPPRSLAVQCFYAWRRQLGTVRQISAAAAGVTSECCKSRLFRRYTESANPTATFIGCSVFLRMAPSAMLHHCKSLPLVLRPAA